MCLLQVGEAYRKVFKLVKVFGGIAGAEPREAPKKLAEEIRDKIHGFQGFLPLINAICNPGLRQRHWALISDAVGFEIKPDEVRRLKCNHASVVLRPLQSFALKSHRESEREREREGEAEAEAETDRDRNRNKKTGPTMHLGCRLGIACAYKRIGSMIP